MTRFKWRLNWKILLFVAVFLPTTVSLGFWQLAREDEKQALLAEMALRSQLPPVGFSDMMSADSQFHRRRVTLDVELVDQANFLLANQIKSGRTGYDVLSLAKVLENPSQLILVNRGWVPASLNREEFPAIVSPIGPISVSGYLYRTDETPLKLGEQHWRYSWPEEIFWLDYAAIFSRINRPDLMLSPWQLRLDPESPIAFDATWIVVNQPPERHRGYAVQWFTMAFVLLILGVFANSNLGALITRNGQEAE